MHELAMTESIIELVEAEARKRGSDRIDGIKLRIGQFTGVVKEALEFAFDAIKHGTLAESAELLIEIVPVRMKCSPCDKVFSPDGIFDFFCPVCDRPAEIVSGRELQIEYIDLG
jgi:hydrogenase nickel incorporation protein HypA/HybF